MQPEASAASRQAWGPGVVAAGQRRDEGGAPTTGALSGLPGRFQLPSPSTGPESAKGPTSSAWQATSGQGAAFENGRAGMATACDVSSYCTQGDQGQMMVARGHVGAVWGPTPVSAAPAGAFGLPAVPGGGSGFSEGSDDGPNQVGGGVKETGWAPGTRAVVGIQTNGRPGAWSGVPGQQVDGPAGGAQQRNWRGGRGGVGSGPGHEASLEDVPLD
jgi:hypothetical protein